jgi:hypothetical protein
MTTITVTWKAFADSLTFKEKVTSATIKTNRIQGDGIAIAEVVFRDTNLYQGVLWDLLEPVLPENRTHTALSVGDEVTVDGRTYQCASIGWVELTFDAVNQ